MRHNIKCSDLVSLQQARKLRVEQAEKELDALSHRAHEADMLFRWVIVAALSIASLLVYGIEKGWL